MLWIGVKEILHRVKSQNMPTCYLFMYHEDYINTFMVVHFCLNRIQCTVVNPETRKQRLLQKEKIFFKNRTVGEL